MSKVMTIINELISEISMGPFGSDIKVDNFVERGVPVLNGSNVNGIKLTENSFNYLTPEKAKSLKKANAKRGDIVITHRGTLGQICYIPENSLYDNYVISQSQFKVSLKRNLVDPIYFTYYFHTNEGQKRLLSFKNHVGVPALAQATTNFRLLEFPLIPIKEQFKIAHILSTLDAKIELNNRINAQLEAMAKTIYDYWFVQFDFPDANGKPYKSSGGKMVWNEELKREVPEGWEVGTLADIADITMGQSPPGESYNEEGIGTVFYQGCTDFGTRFPSVRKYTNSPTRYAKQGDILLSVRAPVGTMNIANENCCIGRGLAALNSKNNSISFLYGAMNNLKQIFDRRNNGGTTFGSITKDDLFSLQVLIPPTEVINQFDKKLNSSFESQNNIEQQNQQLSSLRDWLLPMLMNGQVSVGDAIVNTLIDQSSETNVALLLPIISKCIKDKLGIGYGEVGIQKTVYNIWAIGKIKMNYEFINHNNGTYSWQLSKDLKANAYLSKAISGGREVFIINPDKESEIANILRSNQYKGFRNAIDKVLNVYTSVEINKETNKIELLNTTLKLIADLQSIEFEVIYSGFKKWVIKNDHKHKNKAERFNQSVAKRMLKFVVKEKLYLNILKN